MSARDDYAALDGVSGGWASADIQNALDEIDRLRRANSEADRVRANANKMVLLIEAYIYDPNRVTEGGLVVQIHRFMTDQDMEFEP